VVPAAERAAKLQRAREIKVAVRARRSGRAARTRAAAAAASADSEGDELFDPMPGGAPRGVSFADPPVTTVIPAPSLATATAALIASTRFPDDPALSSAAARLTAAVAALPAAAPSPFRPPTLRSLAGTPIARLMRHRLDNPAARRADAERAACVALGRARDLAVEVRWSTDDEQELTIAVEDMCATGRPLVDTLLAVREAVPHHSLQAVADRWAIMCLADGLWCPGPSDFEVAIRAARRRTEPPSPGRTRSPSPAPAPPSPLLLLPPELLLHTFSALGVRDLSRAARASSGWRDLARPLLDVFEAEFVASEVACVVERLVDAIESGWWPPRPGMQLADSDEDDDYDYWYNDGHDVGDLNGECIGCGAVGVAGGQCLSCGAPVEPWDGSFHYDFGWVDGPRPESE
jgi:hypothetical protein